MQTVWELISPLSAVMLMLAIVTATVIASFSNRYMEGDQQKTSFYKKLILLLPCVSIMLCTDHLWWLLIAYICSDYLLIKMMEHKQQWIASQAASKLISRYFICALLAMGTSFFLLFISAQSTSIRFITQNTHLNQIDHLALGLLCLGVCIKSALFPFHKWLLSSLNSPTPVSALMHAGIINFGGFLLALFAPLLLQTPLLLKGMFTIGALSALLATLWKLMQNNIKGFLACSTVAQMGFMVMQCGLGLFPAAIAHLCWHGFFKAHLFLSSSAAAVQRKTQQQVPQRYKTSILIPALFCGLLSAYTFALASAKTLSCLDTNIFPVGIALIAGTHLSLSLLKNNPFKRLPLTIILSSLAGAIYGLHVLVIELILAPMELMQPQPLATVHLAVFTLFFISSLAILLLPQNARQRHKSRWLVNGYLTLYNMAQPSSTTVTAHRNDYQF